ncbi:MAG: transposase, partial [Terriglobia bacterium]
QACAFFVTRAKKNLQFYLRTSRPVDRSSGLRCDQIIRLTGIRTAQRYPDQLRRIVFYDAEKDSRLTFLTNNFSLLPLLLAQLYRARWQVELFFRWIKQHLRIKAFYGTSENALKTQVWVALAAYVLVAIAKKQLGLEMSLYQILEILSVTIFEKTPILEGFSHFNDQSTDVDPGVQLSRFDL